MVLLMSPESYLRSQGFYLCIELIIIEALGLIFLILDFRKSNDYFAVENEKIDNEEINWRPEKLDATQENIQESFEDPKSPGSPAKNNKSPSKNKVSSRYEKTSYRSPILKRDAPSLPISSTLSGGFRVTQLTSNTGFNKNNKSKEK